MSFTLFKGPMKIFVQCGHLVSKTFLEESDLLLMFETVDDPEMFLLLTGVLSGISTGFEILDDSVDLFDTDEESEIFLALFGVC